MRAHASAYSRADKYFRRVAAIRLWLMRKNARVADGIGELAAFIDVILKGLAPR